MVLYHGCNRNCILVEFVPIPLTRVLLHFTALYYNARKQDFIKKMARNFTYLDKILGPEQSKKHGKEIDQMTTVKDFEGKGVAFVLK